MLPRLRPAPSLSVWTMPATRLAGELKGFEPWNADGIVVSGASPPPRRVSGRSGVSITRKVPGSYGAL